ncbi:MAG: nucleoside 2-deoxyribosyltransferase [Candidatus Saccharibacteria bacterium]
MKIFVAASYSSQVDYDTGEVFPEYKAWLEEQITALESFGHEVFCALRADRYRINDDDPAKAFSLDEEHIKTADGMLACITTKPSVGVQTEIGMMIALGKPVVLARAEDEALAYFNQAIVLAGQAKACTLPLTADPFAR